MMRLLPSVGAGLVGLSLLAGSADASSLRVTPITVERTAPAVAATLTLSNGDQHAVNVQLRVFRWRQVDGKDVLDPTMDVAVSPPIAAIAPGTEYTVRLVRLAKTPVAGEETYRVLVDELPAPAKDADSSVRLLIRYSVPVFFRAADAPRPNVAWDIRDQSGKLVVSAKNAGASRLKVADVTFRDKAGNEFPLAKGLVGYVLGGSSMRWTLAPVGGKMPTAGSGTLRLAGEGKVVDVPVVIRSGAG